MPKITLENGKAVEISQESYKALENAIQKNPYRKLYDDLRKIDSTFPRSTGAARMLRRYTDFIVETVTPGGPAISGVWRILRDAMEYAIICGGQEHDIPFGFCDELIRRVKFQL